MMKNIFKIIFSISFLFFFFDVNAIEESWIYAKIDNLRYEKYDSPAKDSIHLELYMKAGENYDGTYGALYQANIRYNLYLEPGFKMNTSTGFKYKAFIGKKASSNAVGVSKITVGTINGTFFPAIPFGYTGFTMALTVTRQDGAPDLTDEYQLAGKMSLAIDATEEDKATNQLSDASYFVMRTNVNYPNVSGAQGSFFGTYFNEDGVAYSQQGILPYKTEYPFPSTCPPFLTWTGNTSSDWNTLTNWKNTEDGSVPKFLPAKCTYVTIPGGLTNYPVLAFDDKAVCDIIHFKFGGEVVGTPFLTYAGVKVDLTLKPSQWYMLSAPLSNTFSGDFYFSDTPEKRREPGFSMALYQNENPELQQGKNMIDYIGTWSGTFRNVDVKIESGDGFAGRINLNALEGTAAAKSEYTITLPRKDTQYLIYDKYDPTLILDGRIITRESKTKFIYELDWSVKDAAKGEFVLPIRNADIKNYNQLIVGNPFMAHLDLVHFFRVNPNLNGTFRIGTGTADEVKNPKVYKYVKTESIEGIIEVGAEVSTAAPMTLAPMQSMLLECTSEPFVGVNFSVAMTQVDPATKLRSPKHRLNSANTKQNLPNALNLQVSRNGQKLNGATILCVEGGDNGYQFQEDSKALFIKNNVTDKNVEKAVLFSLAGQEPLVVNTVGDLSKPIELGLNTSLSSGLSIDASNLDSFDKSYEIVLHDVYAGIEQNLRENSSYAFDNEIGDVLGRFYISFNKVGGTTGYDEVNTGVYMYSQNGDLYISSSDGLEQVEVLNLLGQTLYKNTSVKATSIKIPMGLKGEHVVVKVKTEKANANQKVLIK